MPASTVGQAPSRSSPAIGLSFATLRRSEKSRTSSRTRSRMRAPCSVMRTVRPTRTISGTPISRSSVWICCETAAEVMFSTRAAAAIEP